MVAGDVGGRTASHELLVRRSHLGSVAQLFHRVKERTDVLLGSVERQGATNLGTEVTTSSTHADDYVLVRTPLRRRQRKFVSKVVGQ